MTSTPFGIRQLSYFVTVAEEGQITRAAVKLHIAQPALSQTISKIEEEAGVALLERHARGVTLTDAGAAFYEKARAAVTAAEDAMRILAPFLRADRELIVGFTPSFYSVVRSIVARFTRGFPGTEVTLRRLAAAERLATLRAGDIDAEFLLAPAGDPELVAEVIRLSPRLVLLADAHRLADERELRFEQIAEESFPGHHPSVSEAWSRFAWLSELRGCDPPLTEDTPASLDELWPIVASGRAISVLPDFMAEAVLGDGVRAVPLIDVEPVPIAIAYRRLDPRKSLGGLKRAALDYARERESAQDGHLSA